MKHKTYNILIQIDNSEIIEWCHENCCSVWSVNTSNIYFNAAGIPGRPLKWLFKFNLEEDAVAFKLRWV